ncbi:uncharacterized protein LOC130957418 [Arachis stenosperma]|uniref:uncharacterized protein LOC130957418 n=1 Tax=Arachis stenosperma TaxID=217475 RepID=UPI0025ACD97A|nr:uncharacterized protein LOC130957418 [Arachis stenosperma]
MMQDAAGFQEVEGADGMATEPASLGSRKLKYGSKGRNLLTYSDRGEHAIRQGDSEIAKAWFDQAAEYWKQAIALTPGLFVCVVQKEEDSMIIRSPEPEVKILVDRDPIKTSFEKWAKPGHFSRTIAKGPILYLDWNYMLMLMISIAILVI